MSRSFKKIPGWTSYRKVRRYVKRLASKKVRKKHGIFNGSSFKKIFNSYDLCDYKSLYFTKREREKYKNDKFEKRAFRK